MVTGRCGHACLILVISLLLIGCEPMGPLPGKGLSGEVSEPPKSWASLNGAEVVQLEASESYSVNLWGVGLDEAYYVASSQGMESGWARHVEQNREVRLRIDSQVFEVRAEEVTDSAELDRVGEAYSAKYELDADTDFPNAVIYRLVPR